MKLFKRTILSILTAAPAAVMSMSVNAGNLSLSDYQAVYGAIQTKLSQPVNSEASWLADLNTETSRLDVKFYNMAAAKNWLETQGAFNNNPIRPVDFASDPNTSITGYNADTNAFTVMSTRDKVNVVIPASQIPSTAQDAWFAAHPKPLTREQMAAEKQAESAAHAAKSAVAKVTADNERDAHDVRYTSGMSKTGATARQQAFEERQGAALTQENIERTAMQIEARDQAPAQSAELVSEAAYQARKEAAAAVKADVQANEASIAVEAANRDDERAYQQRKGQAATDKRHAIEQQGEAARSNELLSHNQRMRPELPEQKTPTPKPVVYAEPIPKAQATPEVKMLMVTPDAAKQITVASEADAVVIDTVNADQDAKIAANAKTEQQHFAALATSVEQARDTGAYAQKRAADAQAYAEANRQALANTNEHVAANSARIASDEQRMNALEQSTSSKFQQLRKEIDGNKKEASAGIAGVGAMANIPQITENMAFGVGAGAANHDGESALAVGMSARVSKNVVTKASIAADTQSGATIGAGVLVGW